jgi:hypothetical protein
MKRLVITIALIMVIISGCDKPEPENSIAEAKLTDREKAILDTIADRSFAFDFKNKDYKEVTIWLEKYTFGEIADEKIAWMKSGIVESGTILFTTSKQADGEYSHSYYIGILDDGGSVSGSGSVDFPDGLPNMMSTWGNLSDQVAINGEIVLAAICYSDDEHGMSGLTTAFWENPARHMNDLKEYDVTYLLKAEFSN